MTVTVNVRPRNHAHMTYIKEAVNALKADDPIEIKDIEMENSGSSSISDLTEMKHRKLKNGTEKFKPKD